MGHGPCEIVQYDIDPLCRSEPEKRADLLLDCASVGQIASYWKAGDGDFKLSVTIPANTLAMVTLPLLHVGKITESGKPLEKTEGLEFLTKTGTEITLGIGSGKYDFVSQ